MARAQLSWPISILAGFAVLLIFVVIGSLETPATAQGDCDPTSAAYPACFRQTATAQVEGIISTQTAAAQQTIAAFDQICQNNPAYPLCPTATATTGSSPNTGGNSGNNTTTTSPTATSTASATPTTTRSTAVTTPTTTITATRIPSEAQPSPTPTSLLPAGIETLVCIPGTTVEISGTADPDTPLLLFFDDRPVGGGLSNAAGDYRLRLQVGDERPGLYLVEVRKRVDRELVEQVGCEVPSGTPTPTFAR
ncbi:MAG: hypothetical protein HC822_21915 [Oscillochloris sp.]|nr:hypothetical protein [Oscillochloris sp.]